MVDHSKTNRFLNVNFRHRQTCKCTLRAMEIPAGFMNDGLAGARDDGG
jgi:hypothetical protein